MKRTILAAGLIYAATSFMTGAAMAGAPINGVGDIGTCPVIGQIKLKPALTFTASAVPIAIKAKAASSGACAGGSGDGTTVTAFKAKGTGTTMTGDTCTSLNGPSSSNLTLTVKWKVSKGSPKLNGSTITFTNQTGGTAMDGNATFDITGSVTAGSFMGNAISAHVETDQTTASLATACGAKGIKKITFSMNSSVTD